MGAICANWLDAVCASLILKRQSARAPERQRQSARAPERQSARAPERQSAMTAPRARKQHRPSSPPDLLPSRRGGHPSPSTASAAGRRVSRACAARARALAPALLALLGALALPAPAAAQTDAPTDFRAAAGDAQVTLAWKARALDSGVTRHEFRYKTDGDYPEDWTPIPNSAPDEANEDSFTVTMLTNGVAHTFELRAVNAAGEAGEAGEAGPVTPTLPLPAVTIAADHESFTAVLDQVTFTLTRTEDPAAALDVSVALTQDKNLIGSEYLAQTVTFRADEATATLNIPAFFFAGNTVTGETALTATVEDGTGYVPGSQNTASTRIRVADPAVTASFEQAAYTFDEAAGDATLAVILRTATGVPVPHADIFLFTSTPRPSPTGRRPTTSNSARMLSSSFHPTSRRMERTSPPARK